MRQGLPRGAVYRGTSQCSPVWLSWGVERRVCPGTACYGGHAHAGREHHMKLPYDCRVAGEMRQLCMTRARIM